MELAAAHGAELSGVVDEAGGEVSGVTSSASSHRGRA